MGNKVALDGVKVIEYGHWVSGPYCGKLLADLGAEVIKVEPPGTGDESRRYGPFPGDIPDPEKSGMFLYLNANKLGITLNLSSTSGRKILEALLGQADIFIENNLPPIMDKLGLTYENLKSVNPRLIMVSLSPFGQTGPYRDYNAYALNIGALGGVTCTQGEQGREPLAMPFYLDHFDPAAIGAAGAIAALFARNKTGRGQHIDISEVETWAVLHTGNQISTYVYQGKVPIRAVVRSPGPYPRALWRCKDGYIGMIAIESSQWTGFQELIGGGELPAWAHDPRFKDRWVCGQEHADELDAIVTAWLLNYTKEEVFTMSQEKHLPVAEVRDAAEVVNCPQLNARGFFRTVNHPRAGEVKYPGPPYVFSGMPLNDKRPAPLLGEHNEMIYCERLGYSKGELVSLRRSWVI